MAERYHEVIREAQFVEEMGFDFWGSSEQHFTGPVATISAPEVLYGAVAHATNRIKLPLSGRLKTPSMLHPCCMEQRGPCVTPCNSLVSCCSTRNMK